jgi:hypothetical protein
MKWTEGYVHVAMRTVIADNGWQLIAGEYPGGSDHDLYPLNVVDPTVARDNSPDPRRHSLGELIPDIVALRGRQLLIGEAKVRYCEADRLKLENLITNRKDHLSQALKVFAKERSFMELLPVEDLEYCPLLVFVAGSTAPTVSGRMSYLRINDLSNGTFEGYLA